MTDQKIKYITIASPKDTKSQKTFDAIQTAKKQGYRPFAKYLFIATKEVMTELQKQFQITKNKAIFALLTN